MPDCDALLVQCFRQVFPALPDSDIRAASMKRLAAWDSAALLLLLSRIEQAFSIRFQPQDVNACVSFADTLRTVTRLASTPTDTVDRH
jgi:acyl carrier protein